MLQVHSKWESIEDDIWAKIIVMERNRRVAKVIFGRISPNSINGLKTYKEG